MEIFDSDGDDVGDNSADDAENDVIDEANEDADEDDESATVSDSGVGAKASADVTNTDEDDWKLESGVVRTSDIVNCGAEISGANTSKTGVVAA